MTTILLIAAWYFIGCYGFYYWWTKDFDLTFKVLPLFLLCGIVGIFSWFVGYSLHGDSTKTIFKKRK